MQDRLPFTDVLVVCGAVGGTAGAQVQAALADLGELDTTRVAMHPGSTQAFGRLGPDAVPTFLFPSHPATALLLFEVLVRPLIRLALGLSDPYRRIGLRPADLAGHLDRRVAAATCAAGCCATAGRRLPRPAAGHRRHPPAVVAGRLQRADRAARAGDGG